MNIAYDAKRAYHNFTGLGHYSRTLITSMATLYPQHRYYLYNPQPSALFNTQQYPHIIEKNPAGIFKLLSSAWRSKFVVPDLVKDGINLYHGLSHEIPFGIQKTGIPSVVTIHDLIHERYPEQYNPVDVRTYTKKYVNACKNSSAIIAISRQTKEDIISYYGIAPDKIVVCYQSCNPAFAIQLSTEEKQRIQLKYGLPEQFYLSVGSLIERKNLLNVCRAINLIKHRLDRPLVVIGNGKAYKKKLQEYIAANGLEKWVIFLSDNPAFKNDIDFTTGRDLPAIYQLATAMVYTSVFEGFGIPVLEALFSKIPVITSNLSCLPEAGGDAALYVNPYAPEAIADALLTAATNGSLCRDSIEKGWLHAQKFLPGTCAEKVMEVYKSIL